MILGFIFGFTLNISIGFSSIGEILYILYGLFFITKNKKIIINHDIKRIAIWSLVFILYTFLYIFSSVDNGLVLKNVVKYADMLCIMLISFELCKIDIKRFLYLFSALLFGNFIGVYVFNSFSTISEFIHYSQFLLLIYFLLILFRNNKLIKIILIILIFVLTIIGSSRTSMMIVFVCIMYSLYQYIIGNKNYSFTSKFKKIFIIILFLLVFSGGIVYLNNKLSYESASNVERKLLLTTAIYEIKENPFFGVGPGNFNNYAQNNLGVSLKSDDLATHNHFLQILAEWGIFGFIIYMIPMLVLISNMLKKCKIKKEYQKIYIYYFVFLFFNVLSGITRFKLSVVLAILYYESFMIGAGEND